MIARAVFFDDCEIGVYAQHVYGSLDPKTGLPKQRMIQRVMERIVDQSIPEAVVDNPHVDVDTAAIKATDAHAVVGQCPDPNCRGDMVMKDGCPTCLDCGYSKCG